VVLQAGEQNNKKTRRYRSSGIIRVIEKKQVTEQKSIVGAGF
jgi:hypothetical protein